MAVTFADRREAGRRLAERLSHTASESPVVLGLPRGGVSVAAEIARALAAPLDVLVVRKIGCPWQPELGVGAISEEGVRFLNESLVARLGIPPEEIEAVVALETEELARRISRYRGDRAGIDVGGRTVILVDDGIATGFTALAAVEAVRRRGAARIVLAVPVAARDSLSSLRAAADEVVVLAVPEFFLAIGGFYDDFRPISDEEVARLLARSEPGTAVAVDPPEPPSRTVRIDLGTVRLPGDLTVPESPRGIVVFAHGSGSSRLSPRNRSVAATLNDARLATLLFDLLTEGESLDRARVFDVPLLAERLRCATAWLQADRATRDLPVGFFGASTGAAAALAAAATMGGEIAAVVSRGGRPDLAGPLLRDVVAPTLLIVGGADDVVLDLNREAQRRLECASRLEIVPGAGHLFEEPGALEHVAALARDWFLAHLGLTSPARARTRPNLK